MMKKLVTSLFFLLLLFRTAAAQTPKRIVSLAPSVTENLYALGLESNVVGISVYCPAGTTKKERIGTLWEPNIEKILTLSPDLVIASKEGNKKGPVHKLRGLGIPVYVVDDDRDFATICANFLSLGKRLGEEDRARTIVVSARARVQEVALKLRGRPLVRVFWEVGARPLFTISRQSFINDFNTYTGCTNIFDDLALRYPQVSREEVLKRDPDALLLVTMGDVTGEEKKYWESFPVLSAARNRRIFVISASEIFTPTPLTFARGVELIASIVHGIN